ncbi:glycosyl hydrolase 108 family protein, partial [Staphylococcus aureus]
MMTFDECFEKLIGHEGCYSNNPKDPGGETKWGVSKRAYPALD